MNPETKFWNFLRPHFLSPAIHLVRVENTCGRGTPDVYCCWNSVGFWLELKVAVNGRVWIRNEQKIFGLKEAKAGGRYYVLALDGENVLAWKFPVETVEEHNMQRITSPPLKVMKKLEFNSEFLYYS